VWHLVQEHLTLLHQKYHHYFLTFNTEQCSWIRNTFFSKAEMSTQELYFPVRKNILELRNDGILILQSSDVPLDEFGTCIEEVYNRIWKVAIEILLHFFISYLCEQSFSSFLLIKNGKRSMLKGN